jgi:pilus assembly protein Flp/PilA
LNSGELFIAEPTQGLVSEEGGESMFLRMYAGVQTWWSDLRTRMQEQEGATAVEYALMVALIAAVIIVAVQFLGNASSSTFSKVGSAVNGAGS